MSDFQPDPALQLLIACADLKCGDRGKALVREAVNSLDGDWPSFIKTVQRHRMAPIALQGLVNAGVEPPSILVERTHVIKRRSLAQIAEGKRLIDLLEEHQIAAMMLKGPALSQLLYDDPGMRESIDLDLLVDWEKFRQARQLLGQAGYDMQGPEPPWGKGRLEIWRKGAKDITFVNRRLGTVLELHHRLKTPDSLLPDLGISRATASVKMAGTSFRAFDRCDLFTYLCVHAASQLWHRLKWLADIRALLSDRSMQDIEELLDRAREHGVERCAALALLLCRQVWGQQLPAVVLEMRATDASLRLLERASLDVLLAEDWQSRKCFVCLSFHFRDDWSYRRSIIPTKMLQPEVVARVPLPAALTFLYVPITLLALLARRLSPPSKGLLR